MKNKMKKIKLDGVLILFMPNGVIESTLILWFRAWEFCHLTNVNDETIMNVVST
jgi:hypothetical protein